MRTSSHGWGVDGDWEWMGRGRRRRKWWDNGRGGWRVGYIRMAYLPTYLLTYLPHRPTDPSTYGSVYLPNSFPDSLPPSPYLFALSLRPKARPPQNPKRKAPPTHENPPINHKTVYATSPRRFLAFISLIQHLDSRSWYRNDSGMSGMRWDGEMGKWLGCSVLIALGVLGRGVLLEYLTSVLDAWNNCATPTSAPLCENKIVPLRVGP